MTGRNVVYGMVLTDPVKKLFPHHLVFGVRPTVDLKLAEADLGQRQMLHFGRSVVNSLMLSVALATTAHVSMERGRLALQ